MRQRRYTMVEILVVIAILVILAGMTLASVGYVMRKAAEANIQAQLKAVCTALAQYESEWGFFPQQTGTDDNALGLKTTFVNSFASSSGKQYLNWAAPDFRSDGDPADPGTYCLDAFDGRIFYLCPGAMNPESYDLWSTGHDEKHGVAGVNDDTAGATDDFGDAQTTDDNDDITNWKRDL